MKIKEILMNKWGWAGAILLPIIVFYLDLADRFIWLRPIIKPEILCFSGHAGCALNWIEQVGCDSTCLGIILAPIIIGFIVGTIANKLWRKFK